MQRYDCHKYIFPHKMYFGEYYSIVRKYPIVVYKICGEGERSFHPKLYLSICHCTEIILWWDGIFDDKKPVVLKRDTAFRNLTGHVTCKGKWKEVQDSNVVSLNMLWRWMYRPMHSKEIDYDYDFVFGK